MLHMPEAPAIAPIDEQHDLIATHPTTTALLTPRWRPAALLHFLRTVVTSCTRRRPLGSRRVRPDLLQWESPTDFLVRQHTYLYIHSLSE